MDIYATMESAMDSEGIENHIGDMLALEATMDAATQE